MSAPRRLRLRPVHSHPWGSGARRWLPACLLQQRLAFQMAGAPRCRNARGLRHHDVAISVEASALAGAVAAAAPARPARSRSRRENSGLPIPFLPDELARFEYKSLAAEGGPAITHLCFASENPLRSSARSLPGNPLLIVRPSDNLYPLARVRNDQARVLKAPPSWRVRATEMIRYKIRAIRAAALDKQARRHSTD